MQQLLGEVRTISVRGILDSAAADHGWSAMYSLRTWFPSILATSIDFISILLYFTQTFMELFHDLMTYLCYIFLFDDGDWIAWLVMIVFQI